MNVWPRRQFLSVLPTLPWLGSVVHAAPAGGKLRAGAAKTDITLPLGTNMGGVILRGGPARRVHDPLYARCLALDDGTTRLALVVCDLRMIGRDLVDRAKKLAADALGWPVGNMLVAATHTHAAPGLVGIQTAADDRWYAELVVLRIADAVRQAAANFQPARIGWASTPKPEHLFNRRYFSVGVTTANNPFGDAVERVVTNPGAAAGSLEPAGPVDPELSVLSVEHADGRPLAVLANYGLHYVGNTTPQTVSADYFGMFADRIQQLLEPEGSDPAVMGMMSNGASGDVNNVDRRGPRDKSPPFQKMRAVADDLAVATVDLCRKIEHHDTLTLAAAGSELELDVRRPDEVRLQWARSVLEKRNDRREPTRIEVYAEEVLALAEGPARVSLFLQALRIGDLGIAAVPCEVFAETGLEIKDRSPLRPTFIIELANGYNGYLPTPRQHVWGGYETWPARSSYLEVDAATKIRDRVLELLNQVGAKE